MSLIPNASAPNLSGYGQSNILAVSDFVRPDFKTTLYNQYGDQFLKEFRLLEAMQAKRDIQRADGGFHFEEERYDSVITVAANAGTSGTTLGFTLNASQVTADSGFRTSYPNVGDLIVDMETMERFRIATKTDNGTVTTITATSIDGTNATPPTAGKQYAIYSNAYGENTGQPDARESYWTKIPFKLQKFKSSIRLTGDAAVNKLFPEVDEMGRFVGNWGGVLRTQGEFRHLKAMIGALILGKEATTGVSTTNGMMEVFSTRANSIDISGGVDLNSLKDLVDVLKPNSPMYNNYIGLICRNLVNPLMDDLVARGANNNIEQFRRTSAELIFGSGEQSEGLMGTFDFHTVTVNGFVFNFRLFDISYDPTVFGIGDPDTNQFANTAYFLPSAGGVDATGAFKRHLEMAIASNPEGGVNRRLKIWEEGANAPIPVGPVDNLTTYYLSQAGFDYFAMKQCGYFYNATLS